MANETLWHIHELIFQDLDHRTVEICRKVCKSWNESESLKTIFRNKLVKYNTLMKFIQDFGDKDVDVEFNEYQYPEKKVSAFIPGWDNAVEKYGAQASIDDLQEIKDSLQKLVRDNGECREIPVHRVAENGDVKLMDLILNTSYDFNARDYFRRTALHYACENGKTEIVQLLITSSKDFNIDLNARDDEGMTAFHEACVYGKTEIFQLMLKNWEEFGLDIKAQNNQGKTPIDYVKERTQKTSRYSELKDNLEQVMKMLEMEYSKMDVQNL